MNILKKRAEMELHRAGKDKSETAVFKLLAKPPAKPPPLKTQNVLALEDSMDFECPVCFQLLCEPVRWRGGCGHVFCKVCLYRCSQRFNHCPVCRSHSSRTPISELVVDEELKLALRSFNQSEYDARSREMSHEASRIERLERCSSLMFFRSTTIQPNPPPGRVLVLRFTEPRYKWMIRRAQGMELEHPPEGPLSHFGIISGRVIEEGNLGILVEILSTRQDADGVVVTIRSKGSFEVVDVSYDIVPHAPSAPALAFGKVRKIEIEHEEQEVDLSPTQYPPRPSSLQTIRTNFSRFVRNIENRFSPSPTNVPSLPYLPSISR